MSTLILLLSNHVYHSLRHTKTGQGSDQNREDIGRGRCLAGNQAGTIREWKRRYMSDGPEGLDRPGNDDLDNEQVPAEYERVMSLDVMDTLDWIRRMPASPY